MHLLCCSALSHPQWDALQCLLSPTHVHMCMHYGVSHGPRGRCCRARGWVARGGTHSNHTGDSSERLCHGHTLCKHTAPKQPPAHTEITPGGHRCQPPALGTCGHPTCTSPAPGHDVAPRSHPPKSAPQCRSQTPCDTPGVTIGPHTWGGGTRLSCACQPGCPKQGRGCPPRGHAAVAGAGRRVPAQPLHAQGMEPFRSLPPC